MPALTTHKLFAENILKNLNKKQIDIDTYYMFSQSHDILFYYIGKNKKLYKNIGKKGHHKNTKQYIMTVINCIKNNNLENNKQCMSYLYGILTHYYLDSTLHPFIFYKTGVYRNNNATKKYKGLHNIFERQLDSIMYQRILKKEYKDCDITKDILPETKLNEQLCSLIDIAYSKNYKEDKMSKIIIKGYKTMRLFHKLVVKDPKNIKYKLYKFIDKLNKEKKLQAYSTSIETTEKILNLKNSTWYHPSDMKIKYTDSLLDLYKKAEENCIKAIKEIDKYLKDNRNDLNDIIKDIDYSTGLEIKDNKKMRYFE